MIQESMLPDSLKSTLASYLEWSTLQQSLQTTLVENISQIVTMWSSYIKNAGDFAVWLLVNTFSAIFQIAIVFTVAVFGSIEKKSVSKFIASLSSTPHHTQKTVNWLYDKLWDWLVWQILLSLCVWILVGIWLMILSRLWLGLPNSFTLALIAWLTEFIPYLGPILGSVPWIFVATLAFWFKWFIAAWIMYMIVQWTENNILVPLIMSQTLWVSPLLIFVSMLILWTLLWLLWVVIAVPIAVILNIMYKEYMKRSLIKEQEL
jgi:predicted PurR-regulated permease PerM